MNSTTIIIIELLFMAAVTSADVRAAGQDIDCVRAGQMRIILDKYKACLDLRSTTRTRERSHVQDVDKEYCREMNQKLLEEIEKHGMSQEGTQDKRTDVLEQLLLEPSGGASPHPDRCQ